MSPGAYGSNQGISAMQQMLGVVNLTNGNLTMDNPNHLVFNTFYVNNTIAGSAPDQQNLGSISFINCFLAWEVGPGDKPAASIVAAIVVPVVVAVVLALGLGGFVWRRKRRAALRERERDLSKGGVDLDKVVVEGCGKGGEFGDIGGTGTGSKLAVVGDHEGSLESSNVSDSRHKSRSGPSQDIQEACRNIVGTRAQSDTEPIHLDGVLGEGSYGKVRWGEGLGVFAVWGVGSRGAMPE